MKIKGNLQRYTHTYTFWLKFCLRFFYKVLCGLNFYHKFYSSSINFHPFYKFHLRLTHQLIKQSFHKLQTFAVGLVLFLHKFLLALFWCMKSLLKTHNCPFYQDICFCYQMMHNKTLCFLDQLGKNIQKGVAR